MTSLAFLINSLFDKNNTTACDAMKTLAELSEQSDEVYAYMDTFIEMLESSNSYVRNRGLILIAANARCAHVIIRPEFENPVIARV